MSEFAIKQDDTSPALAATLTDDDGNAIDLSGASVRFLMTPMHGDTPTIDASADIVDAADGKVEYLWSSGDTDTAGRYHAEFEVTYSDSTVETFPNTGYITVRVWNDLG